MGRSQPLVVVFECGRRLTFDVELSDTIDNIKAKIQEIEGIPQGRQRLLHKDVQLRKGSRSLVSAAVWRGRDRAVLNLRVV